MSTILHGGRDDGPQPYRVITTSFDVDSLLYLADGRLVSSIYRDGMVTFWNAGEGKQLESAFLLHDKDEMSDLALTADGKKIISSDNKGGVKMLDVELDQVVVKEWFDGQEVQAVRVSISPDNRLVAVGSKRVFIHAIEGWQVKQTIEVGELLWCMSFSPAGNKLVCSTTFDIRIYDVDSGTLILGPFETDGVRAVLWSRDGSKLFSASWDKAIRCWNADTGEQIGHPWIGHTSWIYSLALSLDGRILASASLDKTARFWNATTGDPIGRPLQHKNNVWDVCFSPSGKFLASIASNEIYIWRAPKLNTVCKSIYFRV